MEGILEIFKLHLNDQILVKEYRCRDIGTIRYIKDENDRVLMDDDIKRRRGGYFHKLFNGTRERGREAKKITLFT